MGVPFRWGVTAAEVAGVWPCDDVVAGDHSYYRGVDVSAEPETIFRWLCQLRVAPYSYDLVDNWGKRSPRQLTPGLENLEVGQTLMTMFTLASFEHPVQITGVTKPGRPERLFGRIAATYRIEPRDNSRRLLAKVNVQYPPGAWGFALNKGLPWGDLVMMRKQLHTLKRLAEGG